MVFSRVTIIGLGLLGGSFALALKKRYSGVYIVGVSRSKDTLKGALDSGMIDEATDSRIDGVAKSSLVVIATPVTTIADIFEEIAPFVEEGTLVTDFGSTKVSIVKRAEEIGLLGAMFVGCHPIAGGEEGGWKSAKEDLFKDKTVVITKTPKTDENGIFILESLWKDLGARVVVLSPAEHDIKLGISSHLVHFAAVGLVGVLKNKEGMEGLYGSGFLDTTRIAKGDEKIWLDIVKTNSSDIISGLSVYISELEKIRLWIEKEDYQSVYDYLKDIRNYRTGL